MINFWKLAYKSVKEQRDQHKVELQQCKSERHHHKAELESYKTNLKQRKEALEFTRDEVKKYKSERDTLIDDLSWYKAKVSRLERENEKLRSRLDEFLEHDYDNQKLYKENRNLLSEFSQHIGNKPSSSTYKYFRAKLDDIGIKEGE